MEECGVFLWSQKGSLTFMGISGAALSVVTGIVCLRQGRALLLIFVEKERDNLLTACLTYLLIVLLFSFSLTFLLT